MKRALTPEERKIHALPRAKAKALHQETIGWRLENMWPLAWMLGFEPAPPVSGAMIDVETIRLLVADQEVEAKLARKRDEVLDLGDLFYCAHNAARERAARWPRPCRKRFHPIAGTGVIHERRHALTWGDVAAREDGDDTDLST